LALMVLMFGACAGSEHAADADSIPDDSAVAFSFVDSGAPKLLPRDEANESFREFRSRALAALARQDTAFLHAMIAPGIRKSFSGDDGVEGLKRSWKMDAPRSDVWTALMRVLTMGGQQPSDSQFIAPYVHAFWPDSMDAFEHVAAIGDSVRVLEAPAVGARWSPGCLEPSL
jgi:hypothetical protein